MIATEARAREMADRLQAALDRQWAAADARSWQDAPRHIREAYGDPNVDDPPSPEAMDAWTTWIERRMNSLRLSWENLEKGRVAVRDDPARVEIYWKRAISNAEGALAELDDGPDAPPAQAAEQASPRPASTKHVAADPADYNASIVWTAAVYGMTGLGTLIVLAVGAFLLGEPVGAIVLVQGALLVIGFLPTLALLHGVLGTLTRRAVEAGRAPESVDSAAAGLPFVPPIGLAVVSWLIVTG